MIYEKHYLRITNFVQLIKDYIFILTDMKNRFSRHLVEQLVHVF